MAANRQVGRPYAVKNSDSSMDELEQELEEEITQAADKWEKFIKVHNYVSIGEIYDNCGKLIRQWSHLIVQNYVSKNCKN